MLLHRDIALMMYKGEGNAHSRLKQPKNCKSGIVKLKKKQRSHHQSLFLEKISEKPDFKENSL